jgi:hypothetical protein
MNEKTESNLVAAAVGSETVFDITEIGIAALVPSKETADPAMV